MNLVTRKSIKVGCASIAVREITQRDFGPVSFISINSWINSQPIRAQVDPEWGHCWYQATYLSPSKKNSVLNIVSVWPSEQWTCCIFPEDLGFLEPFEDAILGFWEIVATLLLSEAERRFIFWLSALPNSPTGWDHIFYDSIEWY